MIEASRRMLRMNSQGELEGINPVIRKTLRELKIKTLQNARLEEMQADKLQQLLKRKERQKEEAMQRFHK